MLDLKEQLDKMRENKSDDVPDLRPDKKAFIAQSIRVVAKEAKKGNDHKLDMYLRIRRSMFRRYYPDCDHEFLAAMQDAGIGVGFVPSK